MLQRARALGDGYADQARIAAVGWSLRARPREPRRPWCLKLKLGSRPTPFWVYDIGQLYCLDEVWVAGEYAPIADGDFDLVLDLGANVGAASIWLHEHHPRAQVVAVEPDPRTAALLRRNVLAFERIAVVEAAVGISEGVGELQLEALSWASRLTSAGTERSDGSATTERSAVAVTTITELLERFGVVASDRVLVKMDIEGSEWDVLRTAGALTGVDEIYGETHSLGAPAEPWRTLADACGASGFVALPTSGEFFHWRRPEA